MRVESTESVVIVASADGRLGRANKLVLEFRRGIDVGGKARGVNMPGHVIDEQRSPAAPRAGGNVQLFLGTSLGEETSAGTGTTGRVRPPGFRGAIWPIALLTAGASLAGCSLLPTLTGPPPALSPAPDIGPPTPGRALRGAIHVHSYLSHDSDGSIERITRLALGAGCDFVALTDHYRYDPPAPLGGPRGDRDGVLFLPGSETSGGHGSVLGIDLPRPLRLPIVRGWAQQQVDRIREAGGLPLLGHCEDFTPWETTGWRGMEVANLHPMAVEASKPGTAFSFFFYPASWFFARLTTYLNPRVLARWDELGRTRRVPGFGACDVHENIRLLGPLGVIIGTYAEGFRAVNTHLIVRRPGAAGIREALLAGRGYVAFEIWGSAAGFRFALFGRGGRLLDTMGAERRFEAGVELRAAAPGGAQLRLIRDGKEVASGVGQLRYLPAEPGVYRVEARLRGDPFVLSNPIYLRAAKPRAAGGAGGASTAGGAGGTVWLR